jgi:adenylate cyclase
MTIIEEIEDLKIKLEQTIDDREQAEVLVEILKKYTNVDISNGSAYLTRLSNLAEKLDETEYKAWVHFINAIDHLDKSNFSEAFLLLEQAISLFSSINNSVGLSWVYNAIGMTYDRQKNYPAALENYLRALNFIENTRDGRLASCYHNIGLIYFFTNDFSMAFEYFQKALEVRKELGDPNRIANALGALGRIQQEQGKPAEAINSYMASIEPLEKEGDKRRLSSIYRSIGETYLGVADYESAKKYFLLALHVYQESPIQHEIELAFTYQAMGDYYLQTKDYDAADVFYRKAMPILGDSSNYQGYKKALVEGLYKLNKAKGNLAEALSYLEQFVDIYKGINSVEVSQKLSGLQLGREMEMKQKEVKSEIEKREIVEEKNLIIAQERDRSETLLLNILPAEVAEELKNKGFTDAKHFTDVTVLFTDFVGFTTVSEQLTPQQLVDELHNCFKAFDDITSKYNIEKIKTVGDAYLAVCGLPLADEAHAENIIRAAIEIKEFMFKRRKELGTKTFEIRIGIHSGSVVAGIVGVKKFAYDIWGDTVNTAARMEQNSEAGKINISEATYELVKDQFTCEYRGEIEAKNKGKMKMYFVES